MTFCYTVEINGSAYHGVFPPFPSNKEDENRMACQRIGAPIPEWNGVNVWLTGGVDSRLGVGRYQLSLENGGEETLSVSRSDVSWEFSCADCTVHYYTSSWGREFEPVEEQLSAERPEVQFGTYSGRSTKGCDTWVGLATERGAQCAALAWSGNWDAHVKLLPDGRRVRAGMGITSYGFSHALKAGEIFEGAEVILTGLAVDLEEASFKMRKFYRRYLSIQPDTLKTLPFSYNGWWPYEDRYINENVMLANAEAAAKIGCTGALMDAGWFGPEKEGENWVDKRGDWSVINTMKFPSGINALGDSINRLGIDFGIWCEIEAAGPKASLNETRPELIARRDGVSLGSVCMGNPETREWALEIVATLVEEYGARWIKFDFNLDQGMGCDCEEHGHGKHDGLYAHVRGYYLFLETVHQRYPRLTIESCSSGGLRLDLGILSRVHYGYLSDPDYSEHHHQCFWGAASYIHPSAAYHFTWSQVLINENVDKEPIKADMPRSRFDYIIRSAMTGIPGISYRLVDFPKWCRDRLTEHIAFYKKYSADYILNGDLFRLTGQPLRDGKGERWCGHQYLSEAGNALQFVYRLAQSEEQRTICLRGLEPGARYQVTFLDADKSFETHGKALMEEGLLFSGMSEESSEIVLIDRIERPL